MLNAVSSLQRLLIALPGGGSVRDAVQILSLCQRCGWKKRAAAAARSIFGVDFRCCPSEGDFNGGDDSCFQVIDATGNDQFSLTQQSADDR